MNETGTPADDAMKRDASIGKKKGFIAKIKDLFAKPKKVEAATGSITTTEEMWNQIGFHRVTGACSTRISC